MASEQELPRKLTAILYADVAGYSRLTGEDEEGTHRRLSEYLDLLASTIDSHRGRVVHYAGDAVLADFDTITDALSCAWESQQALAQRNKEVAAERKVEFRIGVNLGEVIVDRDDIYGDGVNVAARLESLAEPGGICVSESVRGAVGSKLALDFEFMGEREVKNIAEAVRAYRVVAMDEAGDTNSVVCPYPGMVPFSAADARYFFGRDEEIARMVQLLRRQRFMMVIGPSGSGKSSLVYAGLLPELERSRYFGAGYWLIRSLRPGPAPNEALNKVLGDNDSRFEPGSVAALLEAHPPAERLLLLVDQFEEVFTQAQREERARFIAALQALRAPENCALILTLRADFYPDLMNSYLWPVDASQRVEVAPLRGDALRAAIQRPAAEVGVRIEDGLVDQLLADAADEPGALPLMQETMGLLWDDMERRTLRMSAYQQLSAGSNVGKRGALSGLAVAIAMKADATLAELNPNQQAIARRIFLRLIQFGEGRADTRRQQSVDALRAVNDPPGEFEQTLERLTDHRLLTRSGDDERHAPAVDISHETLIDGWSRLQDWADERREAEQIRRRLEAKASEWVRLGKGSGGLLDEAALPEAERWLDSADATDLGFDATLPELVEASQRAIAAAKKASEEARQQELRQAEALAGEQRQRIAEQTLAARRMRASITGLAAVLLVAVAAGLFAWTQSQKAETLAAQEAAAREAAEARRAEANQAKTEAERLRMASITQLLLNQASQQLDIGQDERSALLARQSFLFSHQVRRGLKVQVDGTLRSVIGKPYFSQILSGDNAESVAFSPDGKTLASTRIVNAGVLLWDMDHPGTAPTVLPGYPGDKVPGQPGVPLARLFALTFSPDGKTLIAGNEDGTVGRFDLENPRAPPHTLAKLAGGVWSVAFSPDGRFLAAGSKQDDVFWLWDLAAAMDEPVPVRDVLAATSNTGPPIGVPGGVPVAFSPDGEILASGNLDGTVRLWEPSELRAPVHSLRGHGDAIWAVAFSPDGRTLASASQDTLIRLWDLGDPDAGPMVLSGNEDPIATLAFSPDGDTLVGSNRTDGLLLWSLRNPEVPPRVLHSTADRVAFSPDGTRLASAGMAESNLRLWDLTPSGRPKVLSGHSYGVLSVAFSPDGEMLASGGGESIRLWELAEPNTPPAVVRGHENYVSSVVFSPDGSLLSSVSSDHTVRLWRLGHAIEEMKVLNLPLLEPWAAAFSPDGKILGASSLDGAYVWNTADLGAEPVIHRLGEDWMTEIAFSPDGKTLAATGSDAIIHLQNLENEDAAGLELHGHEGTRVWSLAYSPDGKTLASGGEDATVRLWDLGDPGTPSTILGRHDDDVWRVRFSPDGKHLATASKDTSVRLWDVANLATLPTILYGHEDGVWSVAFSPDGEMLASGSSDDTIRLWDMTHPLTRSTTKELADLVCEKIWRNLTLQEWYMFVGVGVPYERTCSNLPVHPSLLETAAKLAKENDIVGAVALLKRAVELDSELTIDPEQEAQRLAGSGAE